MEPFSSKTVGGSVREMGITMEPFWSKTVGGSAHELGITVSVRVCLIMNHGTILEQNCRGVGT